MPTSSPPIPVTLKIKFKCATLEQFIERYHLDISRSGIFIRTKDPLAVLTLLRFEFQLQDGSPIFSGSGLVVWNRGSDSQGIPGMGVRFNTLTPECQPRLEQILAGQKRLVPSGFVSRYDEGLHAPLSQPASAPTDAAGFGEEPMRGLNVAQLSGWRQVIADSDAGDEAPRHSTGRPLLRSTLLGQGFGLALGLSGRSGHNRPSVTDSREAQATHPLIDERTQGWLGVDAPTEMSLDALSMVRVLAIRDLLEKGLLEQALTQENRQVVKSRLAPRVSISLVPVDPKDFDVRPLTTEEQLVLPDELTAWEWLITAKEAGEKQLLLSISNVLQQGGSPLRKSLPARSLSIAVKVEPHVAQPILGTANLRWLLNSLVQSDADLDALCLDYFPRTHQRFSQGMERQLKLNMVLTYERASDIIAALRASYSESFDARLAESQAPPSMPQANAPPRQPQQSRAALPSADIALEAPSSSAKLPPSAAAQRPLASPPQPAPAPVQHPARTAQWVVAALICLLAGFAIWHVVWGAPGSPRS